MPLGTTSIVARTDKQCIRQHDAPLYRRVKSTIEEIFHRPAQRPRILCHYQQHTVGLIGAISTGFHGWPNKLAFGGGAILASFVFFFGLGYGARFLAPVFARPRAWAVLDVLIALVMWSIAASLILGQTGAT